MYEKIKGRDVIDVYAPFFKNGWYIDTKTQKLTCMPAIATHAPWIYVHPRPGIHCTVRMNIFNVAGFRPKVCRECFKVVIRPQTVKQLIQLYELMDTVFIKKNLYCKCGIEERPYTFGNYGGYQYNTGLAEGQQNYEIVRELVDLYLGSDVGVILKNGCTEMELRLGPTKKYVVPEWADDFEDEIMAGIELPKKETSTPKTIAPHTIRKWLAFAWDRGDKTCLEFNDGKAIFPNKIDTYHKEA